MSVPPPTRPSFHFTPRQCIALVFFCTLFGAAAQVLIKYGAARLSTGHPWEMLSSWPILTGYSLYAISTILLVLALRDGQLSILYPVISLTYVWVTLLSVAVFRESMNAFKLAGIATIVLGVTVLGKGQSS